MSAAKKPAKKAPARASGRAATKAAAKTSIWDRHRRDLWILALVVVGFFVLFAEIGLLGPTGHVIETGLQSALGLGRYAATVIFLGLAVLMLWGKVDIDRVRLSVGLTLGLAGVSGITHFLGSSPTIHATTNDLGSAGGYLGVIVGGGLHGVLGMAGATVVLFAILVIATMVLTGIGLRVLVAGLWSAVRWCGRTMASWWSARPERTEPEDEVVEEEVPARTRRRKDPPIEEFPVQTTEEYDEAMAAEAALADQEPDIEIADVPAKPKRIKKAAAPIAKGDWTLPSMSLLARIKEQKQDRTAVDAAGEELVDALAAHGVETTLVGYTIGPSVTRFELELGAGVKVAKVTSLNRDIAYAMASPDVRILAPIPGRSAIGVEVPNRQRTLVSLGDLLASEEAISATHPLDVPLGRDISGQTVVINLAEMPHVLISGATGAGKSSCINSLITSLVMRATPDEVRMILIDPKRVELGQYNDLPHLLTPVVVDPRKAAGALHWAVKEMERRYDILAENGVRDITSYKEMLAKGQIEVAPTDQEIGAEILERVTGLETDLPPSGPEEFPYIVIVVDELNDLMMVAARDVEESVVRIAQMARAVGIHLVLATQRPSVDVITGVIKANVPSRMAFAVSSLADSRVILDQAGAERLIGKGDMLLLTASSNVSRRLQSPWVSEDEVRNIVDTWKNQGGRPETGASLELEAVAVGGGSSSSGGGYAGNEDDDDEALRQARDLVIRTQSGSVSMLQRKLRVGFARAGRLMDMLENEGTVGPGEGSKSRKVLITQEEHEAQNG
ncbi:MAG: DUF87 domain-containing protein [Actinobacteria bacterium]|uniref:Unannotated protein n=1 Tax=freshwater metagenome TaxID=449393 RepID=A0A6J6WG03_9ZZZZ|nr:DUF87 domain-containing protein [Actinomycetota bacterium]